MKRKIRSIGLILFFLIGVEAMVWGKGAGTPALGQTRTISSPTTTSSIQTLTPVPGQIGNLPTKSVSLPAKSPQPSGKLSLEQIYNLSLEQKQFVGTMLPTRSIATKGGDFFTQSEAHMSVPEVKKLLDATYDLKPYKKLIDSILAREREYADDFVFYHGMENAWRIPQDLYTRLYLHFSAKKVPNEMQNYIFLRFGGVKGPSSIQAFLLNQLRANGLINDHTLATFLLSVNVALFGNVGTQPECTWQYFIQRREHNSPTYDIYEDIMDIFGLTHKYIKELKALEKLFQTEEQTILQIFIPKHKVDAIGYLAWIRGNPAHDETINMVLQSVETRMFAKTAPALDHFTKLFREEQENNPIFKHMIERVGAGEFSLNYFLNFYRNKPNEIKYINRYQARLIFTNEVLLNPLSGIKIFRYTTTPQEKLHANQQTFDGIIKKIIADKNSTDSEGDIF